MLVFPNSEALTGDLEAIELNVVDNSTSLTGVKALNNVAF